MRHQDPTKGLTSISKQEGSGLIIAIVMSAVLIAIAIFLLGKIIPFSRTIQGMESSLQSQYQSISWAEKALLVYHFQETNFSITDSILFNNPQGNVNYHSGRDEITPKSSQFFVKSLTKKIPLSYKGDVYGETGDGNQRNKIFPGESILLNITGVQQPSQVKKIFFSFFAPNGQDIIPYQCIGKGSDCNEQMFTISLYGVDPNNQESIILNIEPNEILSSRKSVWNFWLDEPGLLGINQIAESMPATDFFDSKVVCDGRCTIEVRAIGDFGENTFLEYEITSATFIPDQNALIVSYGEFNGYSHSFFGKIPQKGYISGINTATQ